MWAESCAGEGSSPQGQWEHVRLQTPFEVMKLTHCNENWRKDFVACERFESSRSVSLCVYLWKQRNSENKDPISVITSNNSLVGFSSVRPLSLSLCVSTLTSGVRSTPQTATIQLLYSAQTYGRKNVRPECMQIHKITFFLFLIKIQKLTISIEARPSTKNIQRAVQLSVCHTGRVWLLILLKSVID